MTTATFDDHAANYDAVALSRVGREYRNRVHQAITPLIDTKSHVLDLGCGTGLDAAWFGLRVESVHAIDPSAAMVLRTKERTATRENVTVAQGDIGSVAGANRFDVVVANFGAINCVVSIEGAGRDLMRLLQPGGHAILVTMPAVTPIERLAALAGRNRSLWGRRVNGPTDINGYEGLTLTYVDAGELAAAMPELELVSARSLGLVLPSFEQRNLLEHRPRTMAALARLDRLASRIGGRVGWGDHIIAVFRKPTR